MSSAIRSRKPPRRKSRIALWLPEEVLEARLQLLLLLALPVPCEPGAQRAVPNLVRCLRLAHPDHDLQVRVVVPPLDPEHVHPEHCRLKERLRGDVNTVRDPVV